MLFILSPLQAKLENNPNIEVCISPSAKADNLKDKLKEANIPVSIIFDTHEYPKLPQKPLRQYFRTEDEFIAANDRFMAEEAECYLEIEKIETNVKNGVYNKYINLSGNSPKECYSINKNPIDPIEEIDNKINQYKLEAINKIFEAALKITNKNSISTANLSLFENELFYIFLLNYVPVEKYNLLNIKTKKELTFIEMEEFIKNITQAQINILLRNFVIVNFVKNKNLKQNDLTKPFTIFTQQNFGSEIDKIGTSENVSLQKKIAPLIKKKKKIMETI